MKTLLKARRVQRGMKSRQLAALTGIDAGLLSKFESGERLPSRVQLDSLALHLGLPGQELRLQWLKAKVLHELRNDMDLLPALLEELHDDLNQGRTSDRLEEPAASYGPFETELSRLNQLQAQLQALRPLDGEKVRAALELEYTYESNRIEGNTLNLQETEQVVMGGLTISGKSMREHLEAINHTEAIAYIRGLAQSDQAISLRDILNMHQLILRTIDSDNAGRFRKVPVMISGSAHLPPQPYQLEKAMEDFMFWFRNTQKRMHPVVFAAEAHLRLVRIHPFIDGNGRTSRLLMNLILLRNGFVIANLKGDASNRKRYYDALEAAHTEGNSTLFIRLILQSETDALERYLHILGFPAA